MRDIACCIWALPGSDSERVVEAARIGFETIDVRPGILTDDDAWSRAGDLGLALSCVAVSAELPDGFSLDDEKGAAKALHLMGERLEKASARGARTAYVVPGKEIDDIAHYSSRLRSLADVAAAYGIRLCVEHFPGTILPTAADTLNFITDTGHANLALLLDIGHLSMSSEDFGNAVRSAGKRLGYVHFDDNDGTNDQHLALGDGVIREKGLSGLCQALSEIEYESGISLELNPQLADPSDALARSLAFARSAST